MRKLLLIVPLALIAGVLFVAAAVGLLPLYNSSTYGDVENETLIVTGINEYANDPFVSMSSYLKKKATTKKKATILKKKAFWLMEPLPGLDPTMASWANDVVMMPTGNGAAGEYQVYVAGGAAEDAGGMTKPVCWTYEEGGPWIIKQMPIPPGYMETGEINDVTMGEFMGGDVCVASGWVDGTSNVMNAVVWTENGGGGLMAHPLPTYDPDFMSYVNHAKVTMSTIYAVGAAYEGAVKLPQLWEYNGVMWTRTPLPTLANGMDGGASVFLMDSDYGLMIAGHACTALAEERPVVWTFDGDNWVIQDIGVVPGETTGMIMAGVVTQMQGLQLVGLSGELGKAKKKATVWKKKTTVSPWEVTDLTQSLVVNNVIPHVATGVDIHGRIAGYGVPPAMAAAMEAPRFSYAQADTDSAVAFLLTPNPPVGGEETPTSPNGEPTIETYPNPFNPALTVEYRAHAPGHAKITVHDAAGRFVATLFEGRVADTRAHTLEWDGVDHAGRAVASGMYFVRFQSAGRVTSQKVVLVK